MPLQSGMMHTVAKPFKTGFVVGKFIPLHLGHLYLLSTAMGRSDTLVILSYTSNDHGYSADARQAVLEAHFPSALIKVLPASADVPDDDADADVHREFCAKKIVELGWPIPDVVFTSEDYGYGFAKHLSKFFEKRIAHICVDKDRVAFPVSATKIRNGELEYDKWSAM